MILVCSTTSASAFSRFSRLLTSREKTATYLVSRCEISQQIQRSTITTCAIKSCLLVSKPKVKQATTFGRTFSTSLLKSPNLANSINSSKFCWKQLSTHASPKTFLWLSWDISQACCLMKKEKKWGCLLNCKSSKMLSTRRNNESHISSSNLFWPG
jgi:hypothetical protein